MRPTLLFTSSYKTTVLVLYLLPAMRPAEFYPLADSRPHFIRCCYKTVDSAMAASRYRFCSYKHYFLRKTNNIQIIKSTFLLLLSFIIEGVRNKINIWHISSVSQKPLWCIYCKIHRYVAPPPPPLMLQAFSHQAATFSSPIYLLEPCVYQSCQL